MSLSGLLGMNAPGGLFGTIPSSPMAGDGSMPMPITSAVPREPGKGGLFGSGYDGEDIMSMLLRAAAIAQGDLGAGAEFGSRIGARARAAAEAAAAERQHQQRRGEAREDKIWDANNIPKDLPSDVREARWLMGATPEERRAYFATKGPVVATQNGNTVAYNRDMTPYGSVPGGGQLPTVTDEASYAAIPPGGEYTTPGGEIRRKPAGGGGGNAPGNFRP